MSGVVNPEHKRGHLHQGGQSGGEDIKVAGGRCGKTLGLLTEGESEDFEV